MGTMAGFTTVYPLRSGIIVQENQGKCFIMENRSVNDAGLPMSYALYNGGKIKHIYANTLSTCEHDPHMV